MNLPELLTRLKNYDRVSGSPLSRYLVKGTLASAVIQACAMIITFFTPFTIARLAGAEEYGRYTYLVACITTAASIALLGLDNLLVREAAASKATGSAAGFKGLFIIAFCTVLGISVLLCFLLPPFFVATAPKAGISQVIKPALIALPMLALTLLLQAGLQGMHKVIAAQLADKIIKPLCFLLPVVIGYFFFKQPVTVNSLIWFNIAATAAGLIWVASHCSSFLHPVFTGLKANYETHKWAKSTLYFFVLGLVQLINARADVLMLGALKSGLDAGVYNIAARLSDVIGMPLFILNMVIAPSIAGLYFSGKKVRLQKVTAASAIAAFALSLPAALVLVLWGMPVLAFFGESFTGGYPAMVIIVIAQLVNVACGPSGNILSLTGFEQFAFTGMLAGSAVNLSLNIFLIPTYGINGAAAATAAGIVVWNVTMLYFVHKKVNIRPSVWGIFKK